MNTALLIVLGVLAAGIGIAARVLKWRLHAKWKADRRPNIGISARDWAVIASPAVVEVVLLLLGLVPSIRPDILWLGSAAQDALRLVPFLPSSNPLSLFTGATAASYLVFLAATMFFFAWIVFGRYHKPANYDARPIPAGGALGGAIFWLLILFTGHLFLWWLALLMLPGGLIMVRTACLWLKFRRSAATPQLPMSDKTAESNSARRW
jgi:hypothetical protein